MQKISDAQILAELRNGGTLGEIMARTGGYGGRQSARIQRLATDYGFLIDPGKVGPKNATQAANDKALAEFFKSDGRKSFEISNGIILIASDAHYWHGPASPAHRAFLEFCRNLRPCAVVMNGDSFDGASISRHPRIGWNKKPTVRQELEACKERMGEIEDAAGTKNLWWMLGNHDARYETFLAAHAPEYEHVSGFRLKDHFPMWRCGWALFVNDDAVIKHRFKNGTHATHNGALWAGRSIFTGHLHSLKVTPLTDYNGTRYGVDTGTLADPLGPQFSDYLEENPTNWRSGFVVATWHNGRLLYPEVVMVDGETVQWRGTVATV